MKFTPNNQYRYGQDGMQFHGIPAGVDFRVVSIWRGGVVVLEGPGYGLHGAIGGDAYGAGRLYAWGSKRLLERARRQRRRRPAWAGEPEEVRQETDSE